MQPQQISRAAGFLFWGGLLTKNPAKPMILRVFFRETTPDLK